MNFSDLKLLEYLQKIDSISNKDFYKEDYIEFFNIIEFREFIIKAIVENLSLKNDKRFFYDSMYWCSLKNCIVNIGNFKIGISFRNETQPLIDFFNFKNYIWEENIERIRNFLSYKTGLSVVVKKNKINSLSEIEIENSIVRIRNIDDLDELLSSSHFSELINNILCSENMTWLLNVPVIDTFAKSLPVIINYSYSAKTCDTNYYECNLNLSVISYYNGKIGIKFTNYNEVLNFAISNIKNEYVNIDKLEENIYLVGFDTEFILDGYSSLVILWKYGIAVNFNTENTKNGIEIYSLDDSSIFDCRYKIVDIKSDNKSIIEIIRKISKEKDVNWNAKYSSMIEYIGLDLGYIEYCVVTVSKI